MDNMRRVEPAVPSSNVNSPVPQPTIQPQPIDQPAPGVKLAPKKRHKRFILIALLIFILLLASLLIGGVVAYRWQLSAVNSVDNSRKLVTISVGSTPEAIAAQLKNDSLIHSQQIFLLYTRLQGVQAKLQAGTYRLSPSDTLPKIVEHIVSGKVDTFQLTFLPGATLQQNRTTLLKAGYSATEVDAALAKSYSSTLFDSKPATADLEGYIYPETYSFASDTTVESILTHIFAYFNGVVQQEGLVAKFKAQGLNLYQGITLASIIQRESTFVGNDAAQIAQVFYLRLAQGMPLGSDPTYQYIADKMGVERDVNIDSPYNTRRYAGLPPGPISAPGLEALRATANPAPGDYLYFFSGDDNVTYFSRTLAEHEAGVKLHCVKKCQII